MSLFLSSLLSGVSTGCLYAFVAVGYTVVFKATGVFNLAQGDLVRLELDAEQRRDERGQGPSREHGLLEVLVGAGEAVGRPGEVGRVGEHPLEQAAQGEVDLGARVLGNDQQPRLCAANRCPFLNLRS